MIEQSARSCDDYVRFFAKSDSLRDHFHAAYYYCCSDGDEGAESVKCLGNLVGQFAGWGHDEAEEGLRLVHQSYRLLVGDLDMAEAGAHLAVLEAQKLLSSHFQSQQAQ